MENRGILYDGYPSIVEIKEANNWPSEERFRRGPVAISECVQQIPCNPCEKSCPVHAIHVGSPITNTPRIDLDLCVGCGNCVALCPGLAIFVVDKTYSEQEATVTFPFEYLPQPVVGDEIQALNRAGEFVCTGRVVRIVNKKKNDHTAVITIAIPKVHADQVRTMQREGVAEVKDPWENAKGNDKIPDEMIVCRCEEVTAGEIRRAIREHGARTVTEVKRRVRSGMGLCQGRTCSKLTMKILAEETGRMSEEISPATSRPPVRPVTFGELARGGTKDE